MHSFYSQKELFEFGFLSLGANVLISRKASIYGASNISLGNNVRVDDFAILSGEIAIASFIHIAAYTALYGGGAGITVEDFVNISSKVAIYAVSDDYSGLSMTNPMVPEIYKSIINAPVLIKRHSILGSGCTVFPNVTIAEGSAFGAMTLVNRDSEPWSINVGIPFRKIKSRSKNLLNLEKLFLEERNA